MTNFRHAPLLMSFLLLLSVLLLSTPTAQAQTIDNPTVFKIGTCQTLSQYLGNFTISFARRIYEAIDFYTEFHVKGQGPFLINGNYYTIEVELQDYQLSFELMAQQYTEMYQQGITAFVAPLFGFVYGAAVPELFANFPQVPTLFYTVNTIREVIEYPNTFFTAASQYKAFDSTLRAAVIQGARSITCMWSVSDLSNENACTGAFEIASRFGMESSGISYPIMSDAVEDASTRALLYQNVSSTLEMIRYTDMGDVLLISSYPEGVSAVATALRQQNWTPNLVAFSPYLLPDQQADVQDGQYFVASAPWYSGLNFTGDQYFGTSEEFAANYLKITGLQPGVIDVGMVSALQSLESGLRDAIERFDITDGSLPTIEQLLFSVARINEATFTGQLFFDLYGQTEVPWTSIQLNGDTPAYNPYEEIAQNDTLLLSEKTIKQHAAVSRSTEAPVDGNYSGSSVVSPLELRSATLVYPVPTYEEREENLGYYKNSEEIVFTVLAVVLIVFLFVLVALTVAWRDKGVIRYAQPEFIVFALLGFAVVCCSVFSWQLYVTEAGCIATAWLLAVGIGIILAAQIARTIRVTYTMQQVAKMRTSPFPLHYAILIFVLLLLPVVVLLISLSARGAVDSQLVADVLRPINNYTECVLDKPYVEVIMLGVYFALMFITWAVMVFFSYRLLQAQYVLHEIVVSIGGCCLLSVCGVVVVVIQIIDMSRSAQYTIRCIIILVCTLFYALSILYKLHECKSGVKALNSVGHSVGSNFGTAPHHSFENGSSVTQSSSKSTNASPTAAASPRRLATNGP